MGELSFHLAAAWFWQNLGIKKKNCGDTNSKILEIFIQTLLEVVVLCTDFASLYFSSKLHFYLCTVDDVGVLLVCLLFFKVRWQREEKTLERTCVKPLRAPNFTEQQRLFSFFFFLFFLFRWGLPSELTSPLCNVLFS